LLTADRQRGGLASEALRIADFSKRLLPAHYRLGCRPSRPDRARPSRHTCAPSVHPGMLSLAYALNKHARSRYTYAAINSLSDGWFRPFSTRSAHPIALRKAHKAQLHVSAASDETLPQIFAERGSGGCPQKAPPRTTAHVLTTAHFPIEYWKNHHPHVKQVRRGAPCAVVAISDAGRNRTVARENRRIGRCKW
jgi:hypothetical protein